MLLWERRSTAFIVRLGLIALIVLVFIIHFNHDGVLSPSISSGRSSFWTDKNDTASTTNDSTTNTVQHNAQHDGGNNGNNGDSGDKSNETISRLLEQHPVCANIILDDSSNNGKKEKRIDLKKLIDYVPVSQHNDSTTATTSSSLPSSSLRYNHLCPFMKARYNCADAPHDPPATHWKAVLRRKEKKNDDDIDEYCDVRAFVNDAGGPDGIAKLLFLLQKNRNNNNNKNDSDVQSQPSHFNVLLQGNSYLRQILEAMGCGWSHQLTRSRMMLGGPSISLAALAARNHTKIPLYDDDGGSSRMAEPVDLLPLSSSFHRNGSCHGISNTTDIRTYYRPGMEPRDNIGDCSDNLAMLEFGEYLRIHYIFRSNVYENRTELYEFLQFDANDIHVLLYNNDNSEKQIEGRPQQQQQHQHDGDGDSSLIVKKYTLMDVADEFLVALQQRQIGKAYTADNPYTKGYHDKHPCLPGIPDDEANLVLFVLLMGIEKFDL